MKPPLYNDKVAFYYRDVYMGDFIRAVDGKYNFWPCLSTAEAWTEKMVEALAEEMVRLNGIKKLD